MKNENGCAKNEDIKAGHFSIFAVLFLFHFCLILSPPTALSVCNKYEEAAEPIRPPLHQPVATTPAEEMPKRNKKY